MACGLLERRGQRLPGHGIIGRQAQFLAEGCGRRRQIPQMKPGHPKIVPSRCIIRLQAQRLFKLGHRIFQPPGQL